MDSDIVEVIQLRRSLYFGRVVRMNNERYLRVVLHGHVNGTRHKELTRKR